MTKTRNHVPTIKHLSLSSKNQQALCGPCLQNCAGDMCGYQLGLGWDRSPENCTEWDLLAIWIHFHWQSLTKGDPVVVHLLLKVCRHLTNWFKAEHFYCIEEKESRKPEIRKPEQDPQKKIDREGGWRAMDEKGKGKLYVIIYVNPYGVHIFRVLASYNCQFSWNRFDD